MSPNTYILLPWRTGVVKFRPVVGSTTHEPYDMESLAKRMHAYPTEFHPETSYMNGFSGTKSDVLVGNSKLKHGHPGNPKIGNSHREWRWPIMDATLFLLNASAYIVLRTGVLVLYVDIFLGWGPPLFSHIHLMGPTCRHFIRAKVLTVRDDWNIRCTTNMWLWWRRSLISKIKMTAAHAALRPWTRDGKI